ncbi:GumC family protein [Novosphingobium sp. M1R2S20]|uniref:GumC family protein n=1 Tax=Novosphingobium rhizovicinum TaxID=3228928 RepID=A0ABV3R9A2_9SPHN
MADGDGAVTTERAKRPFATPVSRLRTSWALIYRNRVAILLIVAASLLIGLAFVLFMPRVYQATTSVQVEAPVAPLASSDESHRRSGSDVERYLHTQVEVLKSRAMAQRVAARLDLANSDEFSAAVPLNVSSASAAEQEDQVVQALREHLSVDLRDNSQIVQIAFRSRDTQTAAKVANAYAEEYAAANIERAVSAGDYPRKLLQEQLSRAKDRLDAAERALVNYVRASQLIDPGSTARGNADGSAAGSLITADLAQLKSALIDARVARIQAQQRWEQAQNAPATSLSEALSNPAMQQLLQRQAELKGTLGQMREHMRPDHPTVQRTMAELAVTDRELRALGDDIRNSVRDEYLTRQRQEQALSEQARALRGDILAQQDRSVRYDSLRREVETNRQTHDGLLRLYTELTGLAATGSSNISVIDTAEPPLTPISPRPLLTMLAALAGGLLLAVLYALGHEKLDDTILDPTDVETKLHLPLLGVVPEYTGDSLHEAMHGQSAERAYYLDHSALELSSSKELPSSLLITSSREGEGKSVTAFVMARDLAQLGRKVLLVDLDLQRPALHHFLNVAFDAPGLTSVLGNKAAAADAIVKGADGLPDFLASGPRAPNPGALIMRPALEELLDRLAGEYEIVILDGPPVTAWTLAARLTALASATAFVTEAGAAHFGQARAAVSRLSRAHGNLVGCIVTKYNARKVGYTEAGDFYGSANATQG